MSQAPPDQDPRPQRFPGYDVLDQSGTWDRATQGVVLGRMGPQPALRFFSPAEEATAGALFALLLDQRAEEPYVPVLAMVDARLAELQTDGWRYEDMPPDDQAWRRSLTALDLDAERHESAGAGGFAALPTDRQAVRIQAVQDLGAKPWYGLPASQVWSLWTRYACTAYYSHPYAWNEIGFGGPAYPRGYLRLGVDAREPWEVADRHPEQDPAATDTSTGTAS